MFSSGINPLNAELNNICHLLTLSRAHHILHVSRIRVKTKIVTTYSKFLTQGNGLGCFYFKKELYVRAYETMNWEVVGELVNWASVIGLATN